jgi:hypothetical protein
MFSLVSEEMRLCIRDVNYFGLGKFIPHWLLLDVFLLSWSTLWSEKWEMSKLKKILTLVSRPKRKASCESHTLWWAHHLLPWLTKWEESIRVLQNETYSTLIFITLHLQSFTLDDFDSRTGNHLLLAKSLTIKETQHCINYLSLITWKSHDCSCKWETEVFSRIFDQ